MDWMNVPTRTIRRLTLPLWIVLLFFSLVNPAMAQTRIAIAKDDFTGSTKWKLNANAHFDSNGDLELTKSGAQAGGSAFTKGMIALDENRRFSTYMEFSVASGVRNTGDGIVFVLQSTANTLGTSGLDMGYQNMPGSVGIEFDVSDDGLAKGDPDANHIAVNTNGVENPVCTFPLNPAVFDLVSGINQVWIRYDANILTIDYKKSTGAGVQTVTCPLNLSALLTSEKVYAGFTAAATAPAKENTIRQFYFSNDPTAIVPGTDLTGLSENHAPIDLFISNNLVTENAAAGTVVCSVGVTDVDVGDQATYTLIDGAGSEDNASFTLTGSILKINVSPDYELKNNYKIRLRIKDNAGDVYEEAFIILISDLNEAPTGFTLSSSSINENSASGTTAGTFSATDSDSGNTNTYTLVNGAGADDNSSFTIESNTLKTAASFNYETKSSFSIRVRLNDGLNTLEQTFTVTVNNINEMPTAIALSASSIAENTAAGTTVGILTATDPDTGNTFTYSLVSGTGSTDNASFSVSGSSLTMQVSPNYESKSNYAIRVNVNDGVNNYAQALTVTVTNVNEAPTDIALSNSGIDENGSVNQFIAVISRTDPDGPSATYSLVSGAGSEDNANFTISSTSLRAAQSFNYEAKTSHNIRIRVSDGEFSYEEALTITIRNLNEVPTDLTLSAMAVAENQPAGTSVGTFATVDQDTNNAYTYTLISGAGSTDNASFSVSGTSLRTAAVFNYESKSVYAIRVNVYDGQNNYPKTFTISVTNENDMPTDLVLSASSVPENADPGTIVGTLSAADPDGAGTYIYSLVNGSGDSDNGKFSVEGNQLKTTAAFDYESSNPFSIRLNVHDGGLDLAKVFTIFVTDVNEAPTQLSLSASTVSESDSPGKPIGEFNTADPDSGNVYTYQLISGEGDTHNAYFVIDGTRLHLAQTPDYEQVSTLHLRVRVQDGMNTYIQALQVTVTDIKEVPTAIDLTGSLVAENMPAGTVVGTLSNDSDDSVSFSYAFETGAGDQGNSAFVIDGNQLKTAESLNYEQQTIYSIRVRIDDAAVSLSRTFTVTVTDANDAPSLMTLSNQSMAEHPAIGSFVGTFGVTDEDGSEGHVYSLVNGTGSTDNGRFNITGNQLFVNGTFDYEVKPVYGIRVRVTDQGLTSENAFTVTVTNVNEAPSALSLTSVSFPENEAVNRLVGTIRVTDPDTDNTHLYTLADGEGASDNPLFQIDGNQLRARFSADYETTSAYAVRIAVTDGLNRYEQTFTLSVTNRNEAPAALSMSQQTMPEKRAAGTVVGLLQPDDQDQADTYTYTLVSGEGDTDNAAFEISGQEIRTKTILDHGVKSVYSIRVKSFDGEHEFVQVFPVTIQNIQEVIAVKQDDFSAGDPVSLQGAAQLIQHVIHLTGGQKDQSGSVFAEDPVLIGEDFKFSAHVKFTVSGSGTAEGIQLVLQENAPGAAEPGQRFVITLGEQPAPGFSVPVPRIQLSAGGQSYQLTLSNAQPDSIRLASGNPIYSWVKYDGQKMIVTLSDGMNTQVYTRTIVIAPLITARSFHFGTEADSGTSGHAVLLEKMAFSIDPESVSTDAEMTAVNKNQMPEDIQLTTLLLDEKRTGGYQVIGLSALDPDENGTLVYSLVSGDGDSDNIRFSIDGTELKTAYEFRYEQQQSVRVRIRLTDPSGMYMDRQIVLQVKANLLPASGDAVLHGFEDTPLTIRLEDLNYSDPESVGCVKIRITLLPLNGKLMFNQTEAGLNQIISVSEWKNGVLQFVPDANAFGDDYVRIRVQVADDVQFSTQESELTIHLQSVNDVPVASEQQYFSGEDETVILRSTDFGFTDIDGDLLTKIKITVLPANGLLLLNGAPVILNKDIPVADLDAGRLRFVPAANASGDSYAVFQFKVSDGSSFSVLSQKMTVHVQSVNDPPAVAGSIQTIAEDGMLTLSEAMLGYSDAESDPLSALLISGLPDAGQLQLDGVPVQSVMELEAQALQAGRLTYLPAPDGNGTEYALIRFRVRTGTGAAAAVSAESAVRISVSPVNDLPLAESRTVTTEEDTLYAFKPSDFGFSDADGDSLAAVRITVLPARGKMKWSVLDFKTSQEVTLADLNQGLLRFEPARDETGIPYDQFFFRVSDGTAFSAKSYVLTIHVVSVNDPPILSGAMLEMDEDQTLLIKADRFSYYDPEKASLTALRMDTLPAKGMLLRGGERLNAGDVVHRDDLDAAKLVYKPADNESGTAYVTFRLSASDGVNWSAPATVIIDVRSLNDPPQSADGFVQGTEDHELTLQTADFRYKDAESNVPSKVRIVQLPAKGQLRLAAQPVTNSQEISRSDLDAGKLKYIPLQDSAGETADFFTYQVSDGTEYSTVYRTVMHLKAVNDVPAAAGKTIQTDEDQLYRFQAADFGYSDPDGDPLVRILITALSGAGQLKLNGMNSAAGQSVTADQLAKGLLTFQPATHASGSAYLTIGFRVNDGTSDSSTAYQLILDVHPVNDLPETADVSMSLAEDTAKKLPSAMFPFSDADGEALRGIRITALPGLGVLQASGKTVTLNQFIPAADLEALKLVYVPKLNGFGSPYTEFAFQTADAVSYSEPRKVTVSVTPVNDAPLGANKSIALSAGEPAVIALSQIPFTDADGDPLGGVKIVRLPDKGRFTLNGLPVAVNQDISRAELTAGKWVFDPGTSNAGPAFASFGYRVSDGTVYSLLTFSITIDLIERNDPPVAEPLTFVMQEDQEWNGQLSAADREQRPLVFRTAVEPAKGTVEWTDAAKGMFRYRPAPDQYGTDQFSYQVSDGTWDSAPALVTVSVLPVNDAPAAADGSLKLETGSSLTGLLTGTDREDDRLTYRIVKQPAKGTISLTGQFDGEYIYTAHAGPGGTDSFTFVADDGENESLPATVMVTLRKPNVPPVAEPDAFKMYLDESNVYTGQLKAADEDGDVITYRIITVPAAGVLALQAGTGRFTYRPSHDQNGTDRFTFVANDGKADSVPVFMEIEQRAANAVPYSQNGELVLQEDTEAEGLLTGYDEDGDTLTFAVVSGPEQGELIRSGEGAAEFVYRPNANATGEDSFLFTVSDGRTVSEAAVVMIRIQPVNDPPVAEDAVIQAEAGKVINGTFNAKDADGQPVAFEIADHPLKGKLTLLDKYSGAFSYEPDEDSAAEEIIRFRVSDGIALSNLAQLTVNIAAKPATTSTPSATPSQSPVPAPGPKVTPPPAVIYIPVYIPAPVALPVPFVDAGSAATAMRPDGQQPSKLKPDERRDETAAADENGDGQGTNAAKPSAADSLDNPRKNAGSTDGTGGAGDLTVYANQQPAGTPKPSNRPLLLIAPAVTVEAGQKTVVQMQSVDPDKDTIVYRISKPPVSGNASIDAETGKLTYTAANRSGSDVLTVEATDGTHLKTAEVSVLITLPDRAPRLIPLKSFTAKESVTFSGKILAEEWPGKAVVFELTSLTRNGLILLNPLTGAFTYKPNAFFSGKDQFTAISSDGRKTSKPFTYTIQVEKTVKANQAFVLGSAQGYFRPEQDMTRAELANALVKLAGVPAVKPAQATYRDVPKNDESFSAIEAANRWKIMRGGGDQFDPDGKVSRQELMIILGRLQQGGYLQWTAAQSQATRLIWFIQFTTKKQKMPASPDEPVTRLEVTKILSALFKRGVNPDAGNARQLFKDIPVTHPDYRVIYEAATSYRAVSR